MSNAKDRADQQNRQDPQDNAKAQELICTQCGERYIIRRTDEGSSLRTTLPTKCYKCRRVQRERREKEKEERENRLWQQRKAEEYEEYLRLLPRWNVVSQDSIRPQTDQVLYIIGNGFDLMHCVASSYYSFRDSLGKNSSLHSALETFWTPDDIWYRYDQGNSESNL